MRRICIILFSLIITYNCSTQDLISSVFLKNIPTTYFYTQYGLTVRNAVDLYRITYTTRNVDAALDTASGLVCIPKLAGFEYPLLCYMHGTVGSRYEVPSYGSYEQVLPAIYASFGFIAFCPDYLGLGVNKGIHPYLHAATEATSGLDLMKATEQFASTLQVHSSKQVFLCGYSQGGHASMALHKLIEGSASGYTVAAAAHMSGPYSISTAMRDLVTSDVQYGQVSYVVNISLGLNEVYHFIPNDDITNFFKPEFIPSIQKFKEEKIDLWELNAELSDILMANYGGNFPKKILLDEIINRINNDENDVINVALRENDVYNWKPVAPTRLLYCKNDDQVSYTNSLIAEAKMKSNGAPNVLAVDVSSNSNHTECVNPAVTNSLFHFFAYQTIGVLSATENIDNQVNIYPNPARDYLIIDNDKAVNYEIYNMHGKLLEKGNINNNIIDLKNLISGSYFLKTQNINGSIARIKFIKIE